MAISNLKFFGLLFAFRLFNAILAKGTYMDPDETWQSLEVAHYLVFNAGFLTWEWRHHLREYSYPLIFALVYKTIYILGLDDINVILVYSPYVVVALISTLFDHYNYRFIETYYGNSVAKWGVLLSATSWIMFGHFSRPLSNSIEAMLVTAGFSHWPWKGIKKYARDNEFKKHSLLALSFAALSCIFRPTSGVIWISAVILTLHGLPMYRKIELCLYGTIVMIPAVAVMMVINRIGYGSWSIPLYNFYRFNLSEDLGSWFGESIPIFHFIASIPIIFTILLPAIFYGIANATKAKDSLDPLWVGIATTIIYSFSTHKEYRFLFPILSLGYLYASKGLFDYSGPLPSSPLELVKTLLSGSEQNSKKTGNNNNKKKLQSGNKTKNSEAKFSLRTILLFIVCVNVPISLYTTLLQQPGVVKVMSYLNAEGLKGKVSGVGFLMPCHSTPFYSHFHHDLPMWQLSCEPPLKWEAQEFENNPTEFIEKYLVDKENGKEFDPTMYHLWPSHLQPIGIDQC
ncbi:glycosylphosphatidylinositol anchor biosynthesis [Mycoemilia scoparia]|uniref:Mannosyltransferase n=1 Tax=Mycoemilia scoparia TaxID=417184 RepID=A0A9W8DNW0_9FUNG|nr:glycosylphosphatidylinositol anchor biosynthesis [Mycoemilia scoparia]